MYTLFIDSSSRDMYFDRGIRIISMSNIEAILTQKIAVCRIASN
jgi:hypothetical protein